MAARTKKVVGKKKAAGKRKAATRKKSASVKKSASRRKAVGKKAARKKISLPKMASFPEFPQSLDQFSRQIRKNLSSLEKQINRAGKEYRRGTVSLLRDVSHQLGHFEALGERRWKTLTNNARSDVAKLLRRLEKVVEPPRSTRTKKKPARAR